MGSSAGNTRLFLDANVLLEILLDRPKQKLARELLSQNTDNRYISALTGHLVTHFGIERVELAVLKDFLGDYTMLSLRQADFDWAFANALDNDFEDALQLAVAIRNGCGSFATFDRPLFHRYNKLKQIKIKLLK